MARLTVRLEDELAERVESTAAQKRRSVSDIVREALRSYVAGAEEPESLLQRAKRFGLVGVVKGAPRDLSRNKSHFEGFGT
jgi:metal-responsive CopG/Arc/MetJ family transcriptional regulator